MHPYYVYSRQFQSLTVNSIEDRTNWFYKKKIKWDAIFEPNWAGKPPKPEHHIDMGRLVRWELTVRYNSWKAGSISSRTAYPSCDEGTDHTESWRVPAREAHISRIRRIKQGNEIRGKSPTLALDSTSTACRSCQLVRSPAAASAEPPAINTNGCY